ncbi:MAG: hypothetical protein AAGH41_09505 [Pseudomonadota bacterium]
MRGTIGIAAAWLVMAGCAGPVAPGPHDADLNQVYQNYSAAYAALDPQALVNGTYAEEAVYVRSGPRPPSVGRDAIADNFTGWFAGLKKDGQRLSLAFRVMHRDVFAQSATDVGLYRLRRFGPDGALEDESYGRFLTVFGQDRDGAWRFVRDLDTSATKELWDAQQPVPGLVFDDETHGCAAECAKQKAPSTRAP